MKYQNMINGLPFDEDMVVLEVDIRKLSEYLKNNSVTDFWCADKESRIDGDFKGQKYDGVLNKINNKEAIHMPELYMVDDRVSIMDGRHRLYAFLDSGFDRCDIICNTEDYQKIKEKFGA
ncbi:hypothetical protein [Acetobacter senegalensis]|uniref:hypothetical protein n=1 Tax=Acetobacter senegalensis TaxID=446692 RepID=UPI0026549EF8|nr:hypothetical protein [Acetobacter senegalensis]MDN7350543.1 hypothetical protein [Acetobacter senegalensis]